MAINSGAFRSGQIAAEGRIEAKRLDNAKLFADYQRTNPAATADEQMDYAGRLAGRSKGQLAALPSRDQMQRRHGEYQAMVAAREAAARASQARAARAARAANLTTVQKAATELAVGSNGALSPEDAITSAQVALGIELPPEANELLAGRVVAGAGAELFDRNKDVLKTVLDEGVFDPTIAFDAIGLAPDNPYVAPISRYAGAVVTRNQTVEAERLWGDVPNIVSAEGPLYDDRLTELSGALERGRLTQAQYDSLTGTITERRGHHEANQAAEREAAAQGASGAALRSASSVPAEMQAPFLEQERAAAERGERAPGHVEQLTAFFDGQQATLQQEASTQLAADFQQISARIQQGEFATEDDAILAARSSPSYRNASNAAAIEDAIRETHAAYRSESVMQSSVAALEAGNAAFTQIRQNGAVPLGDIGPADAQELLASILYNPELPQEEAEGAAVADAQRATKLLGELSISTGLPVNDPDLMAEVIRRADANTVNPLLGGGADGASTISMAEMYAAYDETVLSRAAAASPGSSDPNDVVPLAYARTLREMGLDAGDRRGLAAVASSGSFETFKTTFDRNLTRGFEERASLLSAGVDTYQEIEDTYAEAEASFSEAVKALQEIGNVDPVTRQQIRGVVDAIDRGGPVSVQALDEVIGLYEGVIRRADEHALKGDTLIEQGRAVTSVDAMAADIANRNRSFARSSEILARYIGPIQQQLVGLDQQLRTFRSVRERELERIRGEENVHRDEVRTETQAIERTERPPVVGPFGRTRESYEGQQF